MKIIFAPIKPDLSERAAAHLRTIGIAALPPEVEPVLAERVREEVTAAITVAVEEVVDRALKKHLTPANIGRCYMEELGKRAKKATGAPASPPVDAAATAGHPGKVSVARA